MLSKESVIFYSAQQLFVVIFLLITFNFLFVADPFYLNAIFVALVKNSLDCLFDEGFMLALIFEK